MPGIVFLVKTPTPLCILSKFDQSAYPFFLPLSRRILNREGASETMGDRVPELLLGTRMVTSMPTSMLCKLRRRLMTCFQI